MCYKKTKDMDKEQLAKELEKIKTLECCHCLKSTKADVSHSIQVNNLAQSVPPVATARPKARMKNKL